MVKLNLLNDSEEDDNSSRRPAQEPAPGSSSNEMDFSFFQPEDDDSTLDFRPPQSPMGAPVPPPSGKSASSSPAFKAKFAEPPVYDAGESRSRTLIVGGIVALFFLLLLAALWWFNPFASSDPLTANEVPVNTPQVVNEPILEEPQNLLPAPLQRRFGINQQQNFRQLNYASELFGISAAEADYTLFVLTPNQFYVSVTGDSREAITRFRRRIKDKFPDVEVLTVNNADTYINGKQQIISDMAIPVTNQGRKRSPGEYDELPPGDIQGALQRTASKHGLRNITFASGGQSRSDGFRETAYYANLSGSRNSVMNFLNEVAEAYPAVQFNKISIYPANSGTMSGASLKARIEMTVSST